MDEIKSDALEQTYEVVLQGILDERWMRWFEGMQRVELPGGRTLLRGAPLDQAALHGMLSRIRDLGLPLLLVRRGDVELNPNDLIQTGEKNKKEN